MPTQQIRESVVQTEPATDMHALNKLVNFASGFPEVQNAKDKNVWDAYACKVAVR